MKITCLTLWQVSLSSHIDYHMSDGKVCDTVTSVVLRIDTDDGISGWGEVCPIPHYLPAYADGVAPALAHLAPIVIGADPVGPEALMAKVDAWLPGHNYVKSPLDIALWDLTAKVAGLPLYALLGGRRAQSMPLYCSITCVEPAEMSRIAKEGQDEGFQQFQVKLGADSNWEADVARLRYVRETVGNAPLVYGDWNCGASRLDAIRVGKAVSDLDVMLEQPCATLSGCAAVKAATGLPMKIDESAHDGASLLQAHALGCLDAVAIKTSKMGGLSAARRTRDLCAQLEVMMCIEDTWGSDIATAAALHLAATTSPRTLMNTCNLSAYASPRLDPDGPTRKRGRIAPPDGLGLGIAPNPDVLGPPVAMID